MTFLMMVMTRLYGRLARARAQGESGQGIVEYNVLAGALVLIGGAIYLIVNH